MWTIPPRVAVFTALVGASLLLGGCVNPAPRRQAEPAAAGESKFQVAPTLEDKLAIYKPTVDGGANYPLEVKVPVRLRAADERGARYRFLFFDQAGRALNPRAKWRHVRLPSQLTIDLKGAAGTTAARDWQLQVRAE